MTWIPRIEKSTRRETILADVIVGVDRLWWPMGSTSVSSVVFIHAATLIPNFDSSLPIVRPSLEAADSSTLSENNRDQSHCDQRPKNAENPNVDCLIGNSRGLRCVDQNLDAPIKDCLG
jgi:hypothetical protein